MLIMSILCGFIPLLYLLFVLYLLFIHIFFFFFISHVTGCLGLLELNKIQYKYDTIVSVELFITQTGSS